jgi:hypothetical protein
MFSATRDVVAASPGAIYDQLHADMQNPKKLVATTATSAAIGFGTVALLSKAPKVGGFVVAGLAGYQALSYGGSTMDFLGKAGHANTDLQRKQLVDEYSRGIGREGAMFIEATPGAIVGGSLAVKAVGMPNSFNTIGRFVDRNTPTPIKNATLATREFVNEQWAFRGPGRMPLPANILHSDGRVNALEIGEMLSAKHPWTGVETGRSIDLLNMRVSKPIIGKPSSLDPGFRDKPGRILFHTHAPDSPIGTRPGHFDLLATQDVGIVSRGSQTAYFVGQAREFNAAARAGLADAFAPRLQTIVLDSQKKTAFTLDSVWLPKTESWQPAVPRFVDYQAAQETLKRLNIAQPWSQIKEIPVLPSIRGHAVDFGALGWLKTGTVR